MCEPLPARARRRVSTSRRPAGALLALLALALGAAPGARAETAVVLHAARLLDIDAGRVIAPGEVLVEGERIAAVGGSVAHPKGARVIDLGDQTLLPGLIDAHVHLFLHPGAEDLQTVQESVPQRTIRAALAARDDLLAGFTAERDMGTEGAGSADTAVRDAIDQGLIPGPRMRISGNAIDILGGHEDAVGFNPDQQVLSNASYANGVQELVQTIRAQHKEGADFVKIYQTGPDVMRDGTLHAPYQYTTDELQAAIAEAGRLGERVAVHATGEPGTLIAARAGVWSIEHATQLSEETMRLMKEKHIPAVPTLTIFEYFAAHPARPSEAAQAQALFEYKMREFRRQVAAGIPMALGSDVGPFPHGTQAREFELMVKGGMQPLAVLQADLTEGARLLDLEGQIGALAQGRYADIIAVTGNPLADVAALQHVNFVMKGGVIVKGAGAR
jgi:imidazolonepropionase-like amidohydrolase